MVKGKVLYKNINTVVDPLKKAHEYATPGFCTASRSKWTLCATPRPENPETPCSRAARFASKASGMLECWNAGIGDVPSSRTGEVHGSRFSGSAVEKTEDGGNGVGAKNLSPGDVPPKSPDPESTPPPTVNREPLNREPTSTVNHEPLNREPTSTGSSVWTRVWIII